MTALIQDRCFQAEAHNLVITAPGSGNMAGQALSFTLKSSKSTSTVLITKTTASGGVVITDPVNRIVTVSLTETDTFGLNIGTYVVDLWRTDAGSETDYASGIFTIRKPVHNTTTVQTPQQLPGLQLLLQADTGQFQDTTATTQAVNRGDPVKYWADQSGTANHLIQDQANIFPTLAYDLGRRVVFLNGASTLYKILGATTQPNVTIHALVRVTLAASAPIMAFDPTGGANQNMVDICWTESIVEGYMTGNVHITGAGQPFADGNYHLFSFVIGGGQFAFYCDGVPLKPQGTTLTMTIKGFTLGAFMTSLSTISAQGLVANVAEASVYYSAQTPAQVALYAQYCQQAYPTLYPTKGRLFVLLGNSLTDGGGALSLPSQTWTYQCFTGQTWWDTYYNLGVSGYTTLDIINQILPRANALLPLGTTKSVVVIWEGRNDLVVAGVSAAQAQTNLETAYKNAVAAGWGKVFIGTVLPSSGITPATRSALNAGLRTSTVIPSNRLIDFAADPTIGPDGANSNLTYYNADGIHLTAAGYQIAGVTDARPVLSVA